MNFNIGAKIKAMRLAASMTQEQLARRISGLSASDISMAERGKKELTQAQLKQIAKDERISLGYDGCRKDSIVGRIVSERRNRARLTGEDPNAHPWRRWNSVGTIPVSHNPQEYGL